MQITGAEKIGPNSVKFADFSRITTQHIQTVRSRPHLADLPFFVVVENNNNQYVAEEFSCAGYNIRHCRVLASRIAVRGTEAWRFGVVTTETTKHAMVRNLMHTCEAKQLAISSEFLSTTGNANSALTALNEQLKQFAFVSREVRQTEFQQGAEEKTRVHGKAAGKTDDLAFALLQALLYASIAAATPFYMRAFGMQALQLNHRSDTVIQQMCSDPVYNLVDPGKPAKPSSAPTTRRI